MGSLLVSVAFGLALPAASPPVALGIRLFPDLPRTVEIRALDETLPRPCFFRLQEASGVLDWRVIRSGVAVSEPVSFRVPHAAVGHGLFRLEATEIEPLASMIWLGPGEFVMGSPDDEVGRFLDKEEPMTRVTLTRGFWIGACEVTQGQFQAVQGFNPSLFSNDPANPVEDVTWSDATGFCARLTQSERLAGRLPVHLAYRLPTEAEWEYAARAGTSTRFSHGDDPGYVRLRDHAWYGGNSGLRPHPVGMKLPNPWGLYDMHGNVFEWCSDWFGALPGGEVTDPRGPATGMDRIIRGGYWDSSPAFCRSASRVHFPPHTRISYIGFRIVLAEVAVP